MLPDSLQQLILKLWDLTARGVIPWAPGENDEHKFETEGYVVAIRADPARVRILRPDGHTVEEATANALAGAHWPHPGISHYDAAITELAARAARISSGKQRPVRAAMSAFSTPARHPPLPAAMSASHRSERPIFGAIKSFDTSRPARPAHANGAAQPAATQSPEHEPEQPGKNVYSPWIT